MHLLSNNPFEINLNMKEMKSHLDFIAKKVEERAKIMCPSISASELERRMPSFGMLLNRVQGTDTNAEVCKDANGKPVFTSGFLDADFISSTALAKGIVGEFVTSLANNYIPFGEIMKEYYAHSYKYSLELPASCTYAKWESGEACNFELSTDHTTSDYHLGVSLKTCPGSPLWPYVSITCQGPACSSLATFCDDESDCAGESVTCDKKILDSLPYTAFGADKAEVKTLLKLAQLLDDGDDAQEKGPLKKMYGGLVRRWRQLELLVLGAVGQRGRLDESLKMGVCVPKNGLPTLDLNGKIDAKSIKVDAIDATLSVKEKAMKQRITSCTAKGCSNPVMLVGNTLCDTECNVEECGWDGGDCKMWENTKQPADKWRLTEDR